VKLTSSTAVKPPYVLVRCSTVIMALLWHERRSSAWRLPGWPGDRIARCLSQVPQIGGTMHGVSTSTIIIA
jgi:hypothetical protein